MISIFQETLFIDFINVAAGRSKQGDFLTEDDWIIYLKEYSLRIKNP